MYIPEPPVCDRSSIFYRGIPVVTVCGEKYQDEYVELVKKLEKAGWYIMLLNRIVCFQDLTSTTIDLKDILETNKSRMEISDILYVIREDGDELDAITEWAIEYAEATNKPIYYMDVERKEVDIGDRCVVAICGHSMFDAEKRETALSLAKAGFITINLIDDVEMNTWELLALHKKRIDSTDIVYLISKDGVVNPTTMLLIQYAKRQNKLVVNGEDYGYPIYCMNKRRDESDHS